MEIARVSQTASARMRLPRDRGKGGKRGEDESVEMASARRQEGKSFPPCDRYEQSRIMERVKIAVSSFDGAVASFTARRASVISEITRDDCRETTLSPDGGEREISFASRGINTGHSKTESAETSETEGSREGVECDGRRIVGRSAGRCEEITKNIEEREVEETEKEKRGRLRKCRG